VQPPDRSTSVRIAVSLSHIEGLPARPGSSEPADLLALAAAADEAGVDQIVLSEHVVLPEVVSGHPGARPGDPPTRFPFRPAEEYPEPLVALAAIAAATSRARLSTNVVIAPLRPAVLLAKMAATVDVISGGRLDLGVGVGWQRDEFAALGVPFEGVGARLEDTVRACQVLWRGGPSTFSSDTVSFERIYCSPTPRQPEGIPVWFGGSARPVVARRVAELGQGWSPIGNTSPEDVAAGVELIRRRCQEIGRRPDGIDVRCSLPLVTRDDSTGDIIATVGGAADFVAAGATVVQLPPLTRFVGTAADVGPALTDAVAALRAVPAGTTGLTGPA
jgi:probable F420-dependent oxidoreductase